MKIIRRAVSTFSEPARGNIFLNLGDRQQKIFPEKTVLNYKSSGPSLKLGCPCVNRLLAGEEGDRCWRHFLCKAHRPGPTKPEAQVWCDLMSGQLPQ